MINKEIDIDAVVRSNQSEILRVIGRYLSNSYMAEDILQDAYIRAYKYADSFRGEASAKTWITSIAINLAKDYARRESKRQHHSLFNKEVAEMPEKKDVFSEKNDNIIINEAIDSLPTSMQNIIRSVYFECYSLKETANLLNIPYGTAKSRLNRARNKLRLILSET